MKIKNIFLAIVLMFLIIAPLASADLFSDLKQFFMNGNAITGMQTEGETVQQPEPQPVATQPIPVQQQQPEQRPADAQQPMQPAKENVPMPNEQGIMPASQQPQQPMSQQMPQQPQPQTPNQPGPGMQGKCIVGEKEVPCPSERGPFDNVQQPYTSGSQGMPFKQGEQFTSDQMKQQEQITKEALQEKREPINPEMPQGCRGEKDEFGNFRMICETKQVDMEKKMQEICPPDTDTIRETKRCAEGGGNPKTVRDERGCKFVNCQYGREQQTQTQQQGNYFQQKDVQCPPIEELNHVKEKCEKIGGRTIIKQENGCNYADCVSNPSNTNNQGFRACAEDDPAFKQSIKENCEKNGGSPINGFDPRGCPITLCDRPQQVEIRQQGCGPAPDPAQTKNCEAQGGKLVVKYNTEGCIEFTKCEGINQESIESCNKKGPPKETYERCEYDGGKLIVKMDNNGCVAYVDCIRRGNENMIEYQEVTEIPDPGILIEIAFKLEELKKEFDQLSLKSADLAKYYESNGDKANAEKFNRVAGMFGGSKGKINELMLNIRAKIGKLTKEDIVSIKHDVQYIKEVILNDILYVMFTPAEELSTIQTPEFKSEFETTEAETRQYRASEQDPGYVFDQNLRICKPFTFHPPEDPKTRITIKELDGTNCIIVAEADTPLGKMDMTCKYPSYALGMRGPDDLMPYCEGTMKEMYMMHGGPGGKGQVGQTQEPQYRPSGGQMMGCEKVSKGMAGYAKDVCGNECCELGENYENCPKDCMSPQQMNSQQGNYQGQGPGPQGPGGPGGFGNQPMQQGMGPGNFGPGQMGQQGNYQQGNNQGQGQVGQQGNMPGGQGGYYEYSECKDGCSQECPGADRTDCVDGGRRCQCYYERREPEQTYNRPENTVSPQPESTANAGGKTTTTDGTTGTTSGGGEGSSTSGTSTSGGGESAAPAEAAVSTQGGESQ